MGSHGGSSNVTVARQAPEEAPMKAPTVTTTTARHPVVKDHPTKKRPGGAEAAESHRAQRLHLGRRRKLQARFVRANARNNRPQSLARDHHPSPVLERDAAVIFFIYKETTFF